MGIAGGPNLNQDGLVFLYDVFDQDNSYKGEPTTNLAAGLGLTDLGAGLTYIGVEDGWKKYSMSGTWSGGGYPYSMALDGCTFTGGLPYSVKAILKTNVENKFNYFSTSGISYVNQPKDYEGALSSELNSDGSRTVTRTNFAYTSTTGQIGYLFTNPINGITFNPATDFVYLKAFQAEQKTHPTQFTTGTRSSTQGLLDVAGANQIDISNASFNSNAQITFDGTNDYINVPYNTSHNLTNQGTISVWINPASLTQGSYAGLVSQSTGGSANSQAYQLSWRQVSGGLFGSICNGSGTYNDVLASFPSTANAWYNIVFTWNGSLLSIYNNGILSAQSAQTIVNQVLTTDLTIGGYTYKGAGGVDEYFNGSINNVELFNRGFTAQEVLQNYNTKKSRFGLK